MNCYLHPEAQASAFCRSCGRPLCALCLRTVDGTVYCQDHSPEAAYTASAKPNPTTAGSNPYFQAPSPATGAPHLQNSPGLAFVLGWIPGVGAIYNGQYLKGLVHAIIFGLLISLTNSADGTSGQPLLVMMVIAFMFYMAFEAYHTAKKRQLGLVIEEWSSLVGNSAAASRAPIGPIVLIAIGVLFLLDTLHLLDFRQIAPFWPVLLILVGGYMLWTRVTSIRTPDPSSEPYVSGTDAQANPAMGTRHE